MLIKLFGPHRALTIQVFLEKWGIAILVAPIALALWGYYSLLADLKHEHVGFLKAEVLFVMADVTEGRGLTTRFVVKTPDGQDIMVSTNSMTLSASILDTACLEKRRFVKSENVIYSLAQHQKCAE